MSVQVLFGITEGRVPPEMLERIAAEVAAVERELERQVGSEVRLVREVASHTLRAGGKRLRPALVALSASATGLKPDAARARRLGACMELIHMATLMHDDVIDNASTRRGAPTASSVYGATASILSGDVLLAKAMAILAEDGDLAIIRNVSHAVVDLAEGEVLELETRGRFDLSESEHLEILRRKTATFIQSCCEVGGLAAGASPETVARLGEYGLNLGLAFQIADDLLDYRGEGATTGKPRGTDFREGCATLPLIHLAQRLDDKEREFTSSRFGNGASDEDMDTICEWMRRRGAFEDAEREAMRFTERAREALEGLPPSGERDLLDAVAKLIVMRRA